MQYHNISNEDYHKSLKLTCSKLKCFIKNPAEYKALYIDKTIKSVKTEAMKLGSLFHTLILEPEKIDAEYIFISARSATKKEDLLATLTELSDKTKINGKSSSYPKMNVQEIKREIKRIVSIFHKTICTSVQLEEVKNLVDKVLKSKLLINSKTIETKKLLHSKKKLVEKVFYADLLGVKSQAKVDYLINLGNDYIDNWIAIDFKTIDESSMSNISKSSYLYMYDLQCIFYKKVLEKNGINLKHFFFNFVGKKEFSNSVFCHFDKEVETNASTFFHESLLKYKYCLDTNDYTENSYSIVDGKVESNLISTISIPKYKR